MSEKKTNHSVSFEALSSLDAPVSFWKGIPFGLQHVMAMFVANLAPIFIVASAAKMTPAQSATIIQSGLLVAGLGTCLQLYGAWLIGSRLPMVTGISFTYVAAAVAICADKGYGAVVGAVMVGGLLELVLGLTAKYWRRFVPPIVSAIVVTSIGFSLLNVGATSFGGGSGAKDFGSWQNLTLGLISLVACLAFQLLMKGTAKQLSVLFGLVVGYVAAICMGKVDFSGFQNLAIVSVPQFMPFKPEFDWGSIISIGLLYVVSSVEVLGDTAALTKVGLNRTPTERETAGAIAGDGLISTVSGLFGCLPLTSFAQNIGLVAMTKVVNRKVILSGGLILVLASFVPAIAEVFNSLPQAGARRLHDHDVRQHHSFGLPDDCRGGLHAAQHHDCGAFADHRHRLHPGERHLHAVPGTVPTNLRLELHRRGIRGGCDPERRAAQRGALPLCAQGGTGRGRRVITTRHISCA